MGQIIKSLCVCQCICPSVGTLTVAFLDRFSPMAQRNKYPKSKNEFAGGQYRTIPSPILPQNAHLRLRGPENPCKYLVICLKCTRIAEIFASFKKSWSRNTMVASDFRPEVEIWPFGACAMHPAIIIGTVRSLWTWLYGVDTTFHRTHF